jgi:hypothetical protein
LTARALAHRTTFFWNNFLSSKPSNTFVDLDQSLGGNHVGTPLLKLNRLEVASRKARAVPIRTTQIRAAFTPLVVLGEFWIDMMSRSKPAASW